MKVVRDSPESPVATAVKWIEHIIKFGDGEHLKRRTLLFGSSDAINHNIYESLMIPVKFCVTWLIIFMSLLIYYFKFSHIKLKIKKVITIKSSRLV